MSIEIEGVPASITRADYLRLIKGIGMDVTRVRSLELRGEGIYVAVKARRPGETSDIRTSDGYDGIECATHRVFVPVVD